MGQLLRVGLDTPVSPNLGSKQEDKTLWFPSDAEDFVVRWLAPEYSSRGLKFRLRRTRTGDGATAPNWLIDLATRMCCANGVCESIDDLIDIQFDRNDPISARALISHAAKQKFIAASIRFSDGGKTASHKRMPPVDEKSTLQILKCVDRSDFKFVFSPDAVCDVVLDKLGLIEQPLVPRITFSEPGSKVETHPSGLIVIAGGTGTGKSIYARGIVLRWLLRLAAQKYWQLKEKHKYSPPHLVTYEDPIEGWTLQRVAPEDVRESERLDLCAEPQSDLRAGIRVTCRAKNYDIDIFENAYIHALRQKPNVVYIGECREAKDWQLAIELGGTGHLVVTTCHASSLVDTFVKLSGIGTQDAQSRQKLASSLQGVIHLKTTSFSDSNFPNFDESQTFFQLWRRSRESVSNFVVDGLASLVIDDVNIFARSSLAREVLSLQRKGHFDSRDDQSLYETLINAIVPVAFDLDVRGE